MRLFSRLALMRGYDWILLAVVGVLMCIGLAGIYSVDLSRGDTLDFFPTQVIAMGLGLIVLFVAASLHESVYQSVARAGYLLAVLLLGGVLLFGETIRGTTGWFRFAGFSFQPAEFAKVALILVLALWISKQGRRFDRFEFILLSGVLTLILAGLILLQPDLGSALILFGIWFGLLLLSGIKKRYIALLVGGVAVLFCVGWFFLFQDYQRDRLLTFLSPEHDPLGAGYNVSQSIIAIGAGGFFGRGLGFGSQSQLHFLPEAQTDFIFSVIGEELGFIGTFFVIALYGVLCYRLMRGTQRARDDFSAYTLAGIALLFFLQTLVNIGGAVGLLPVTGVTLPFLSYGGSSLIINCLLVGIAESIIRSSK